MATSRSRQRRTPQADSAATPKKREKKDYAPVGGIATCEATEVPSRVTKQSRQWEEIVLHAVKLAKDTPEGKKPQRVVIRDLGGRKPEQVMSCCTSFAARHADSVKGFTIRTRKGKADEVFVWAEPESD